MQGGHRARGPCSSASPLYPTGLPLATVDSAPRKQQPPTEIDLRHPLEVDPLADSWTIEVPYACIRTTSGPIEIATT